MSYRNNNSRFRAAESDHVFRQAGMTATWHQFVSATTGNPAVGLGRTDYHRTQVITGLFADGSRAPRVPETVQDAGLIANADLVLTSRERIGRRDRLEWRGVTYRVEGDPVPATLNNQWINLLVRLDT